MIVSGWMLLVFCYAMFIPNSWERSAAVIGALAAAAVLRWCCLLVDPRVRHAGR